MKTKVTLFATVLAVALFGVGCKTTEKPSPKHFKKSLRGFK